MAKKKEEPVINKPVVSKGVQAQSCDMDANHIPFNGLDVRITKLRKDAVLPSYANVDKNGYMDMCMDLTAVELEYSLEMDCYIYHTGLRIEIPRGTRLLLFPQANNRKTDCYLENSMDNFEDDVCVYFKSRTPLKQRLINAYFDGMIEAMKYGSNRFTINDVIKRSYPSNISDEEQIKFALKFAPYEAGDKVAKMAIVRYPLVKWSEIDSISDLHGEGFEFTGK